MGVGLCWACWVCVGCVGVLGTPLLFVKSARALLTFVYFLEAPSAKRSVIYILVTDESQAHQKQNKRTHATTDIL
jgi:hypothetical protein